MADRTTELPPWLTQPEEYEPIADRGGFVSRTFLQISSALAQLRFDDGRTTPLSPSALVKVLVTLVGILLTSLSRNFIFVLFMLAFVLVRACLLPPRHLRRLAAVVGGAVGLTVLVMLPATLMGQPRSLATLSTKALVSTGLAMELALTTPLSDLMLALRACHVPSVAILTIELALRSIVDLGTVALEALQALTLRSVGLNRDKAGSLGGVGGIVFVKAARASQDTYDAMRCRGFTGAYDQAPVRPFKPVDAAWIAATLALVALFCHLEGMM